jgi:hypothetical protein
MENSSHATMNKKSSLKTTSTYLTNISLAEDYMVHFSNAERLLGLWVDSGFTLKNQF